MSFKSSAAALAAIIIAAPVTFASVAEAAGCGRASWYALTSKTASGERMNPAKLTAAHKSLRFGTKLKVTNANNGKSVVVRINDRGPFIRGRIIDLTPAAASQLGFSGLAPVTLSSN